MSDLEKKPSETEESKIPVFTVLKNNAILKNIFIINQPPPSISGGKLVQTDANVGETLNPYVEYDEIFLVGRHPDCNIVLQHPSISRFHLRVHSKPTLQKLSVVDLSSVHGTWVSGGKIEPNVQVELHEGDTMRIGGSSRVYRLHWLPLSGAYDLDNPFVPDDLTGEEKKEEERVQTSVSAENGVEKLEMASEDVELALSDEPLGSLAKKLAPTAPPMAQDMNTCSVSDQETEEQVFSVAEIFEELEFHHPSSGNGHEQKRSSSLLSATLAADSIAEIGYQQFGSSDNPCLQSSILREVPFDIGNSEGSIEKSDKEYELLGFMGPSLFTEAARVTEEKQSPLGETHEQRELVACCSVPQAAEFVDSCSPDGVVVPSRTYKQSKDENGTPNFFRATEGSSDRENSEAPWMVDKQFNDKYESWDSCYVKEALTENVESPPIRSEPKSNQPTIWSRRGKPATILLLQSSRSGKHKQFDKENQNPASCYSAAGGSTENARGSSLRSEPKSKKCSSRSGFGKLAGVLTARARPSGKGMVSAVYAEALSLKLEDVENKYNSEASYHAFHEKDNSFTPDKENVTPKRLSIWSEKGKLADHLQLQTSRSSKKDTFSGINVEAESPKLANVENNLISKILLSDSDEEAGFTPDKENVTPSRLISCAKRRVDMEEVKQLKPYKPSPMKSVVSPKIHQENVFASSEKENHTPESFEEIITSRSISRPRGRLGSGRMTWKREPERMPFQPLLANSAGESKSEASVQSATRSNSSATCGKTSEGLSIPSRHYFLRAGKRSWNMVVDSTCLLNQESRKSLQLLEGVKGTRLFIPRIVIRELDCLRRRGSLFRRTKEVSSALQWIEECMVKTSWWIHVQVSAEEGRPFAPTPPASPRSHITDRSWGFPGGAPSSTPFSPCGSFMEIVSPTAEDHILDYALLSRRTVNNEQLVLLSNDVTLKIKAMAEGLICESAEEFRDSLVNPFSERFLWADSSPRGLTWSPSGSVVLKEIYDPCASRRPSKGADNAKGLKLILLHNSHYGQIKLAS